MAASTIRKSGRIKSCKKSQFHDDDYEFDKADFNLNVSEDISNLLNSHSTEKSDHNLLQYHESFPNVNKRLCGREKVHNENSSGKYGEKNSYAVAEENDLANFDASQSFHSQSSPSQFTSETNTSEHQGKNKSTKSYTCDQCNKNFFDLAAFKRHLRWHTGERPFKCDQCEKSFTESCSLKRHMKIHEDERPFTCDICLKSFRDPTSFSRHQLTHVERPRSFQCSYCEKNFTDKSGLKRHERTHSGLRPYECSICHKTFSESGSFRRHQKIHIGVRNHHCPRCKRSFMEKQSLIRHQRTVCGFWESPNISDTSQQNETNLCGTNTKFSPEDNYVTSNSDSKAIKIKDFATISSSGPSSVNSQHDSSSLPVLENRQTKRNSESLKCSPSLSSLIQKDPNLYDSISEIVESIDSYEKMLDLCGDSGQKEIEKALTREPSPMPENLMCFECGELLVNGENFKSEGKSFNSKTYNSFKCLNCEEQEDEDKYGEPPVLTAEYCEEGQEKEILPPTHDEESAGTENKIEDCVGYQTSSALGAQEPLEKYDEHVNIQEKMLFNEIAKSDADDNAESKHVHKTIVHSTATSRSPSRQPKPNCENFQTVYPIQVEDEISTHQAIPSLIPIEDINANQTPQSSWDNAPNVEYEADDPNIPSVFPCHLCTKVFATSAFLEQHLELHRKSPHKCMVCGKSFSGNPALKRHMRVHTGEKPYSCPLCAKKFRDPSNFGKHKKFCSSINGFVPSPVGSTSSTMSGTSALSNDENLNDINKNNRDDLRVEVEKTFPPLMPNDKHSTAVYNVKENSDDLTTPFMAVVPSLDDFDEYTKESDENFDQEKQISYIPCEICQKLCENEQHLEMHMNYHNGNPDVTCIECGKTFSDCHGLKRHMHIHAKSRPFTCEYCNRGYCDNWSLKKHKSRGCMNSELQIPIDFLHPCQHCNRVFSEADLLEDHMKCHKGKLGFECDICSKQFSEAFNLKRHRRLHMAICSCCGMEFKDMKEMTKHQQNDCSMSLPAKQEGNSTSSFPCQDCGRTYSTLAYLERHRKFHSDLKPYACQICNKKFSEAFKLRRHERAHTEAKPFVCQECGRGYADEAHLKRHVINSSCTVCKTTRGAVNFPCQYCDKVFSKNYMLVRHMNVHSQERPFSCNICGRSYKDTSSLKRHHLIHQGNKDFICSVCGKAFFYADSLKRHMSGRCGKSLKSRKYKAAYVKRKINFKSQIQDNVNNNNKNQSNDNICDSSISNNSDISYEAMKTEATALESRLHTMPYKSRYSKDFSKESMIFHHQTKSVKLGPWSCRNKKHCWQCDVKMPSSRDLLSHIRIHHHKKKFPCLHCYARFTCKAYWKVHQSLCTLSSKFSGTKKLLTSPSPNLLDVPGKNRQRPRRSIRRAQWSWLTQI